ncbi:MAG TPA: hypothetical protein VIJ18_18135 [Microbacteriaceae bacterium]
MVQTILGPDHELAKRLTKMERDIANLNTRDVLQNASITQGGLTVSGGGSITVDDGGNIVVNVPGKVTVGGIQLSGVTARTSYANSPGGNGVTTTFTTLASCQVVVPAGYTQAIVTAIAAAQAWCDAPGIDYFSVEAATVVSSTGQTGSTWTAGVMSQGSSGTTYGATVYPQISVMSARSFAGLNGGTITATVSVKSLNYAWSANASSGGTVQMTVIFIA